MHVRLRTGFAVNVCTRKDFPLRGAQFYLIALANLVIIIAIKVLFVKKRVIFFLDFGDKGTELLLETKKEDCQTSSNLLSAICLLKNS